MRVRWLVQEMQTRALLALGRFGDARDAADVGLAATTSLGWRMLEWRLRGLRAEALSGLGDARAREERRAAQKLLMEVAKTLSRTALREKFLSQPAAAALMA